MIKLIRFLLVFLIIVIVYLNWSIYYAPEFKTESGIHYNCEVYKQLQFLKRKNSEGEGKKMQRLFPEGFMFFTSLYGLTWCNLIEKLPKDSQIFREGVEEINKTVEQTSSREARRIFNPLLTPEYGAFYSGWSNYLLGRKLQTEPDPGGVLMFKSKCDEIARAVEKAPHPFLESYSSQAWPADMVMCIASLALHDKIFEPIYGEVINNWVEQVKGELEPEIGLIPHVVKAETGESIGPARGSSQSLILNFLIDIDTSFARQQYELYREQFLDYRFFLPGIREYPKGIIDFGDVDSGPVILGIGGAASIVGQRTAGKFGDWATYEGLRNSIEGFGVGMSYFGEKKYLFGALPMADAFIAWANSIEKSEWKKERVENWRIGFQKLSIFLLLIFGAAFYYFSQLIK